jgi:DNA polymerase-4
MVGAVTSDRRHQTAEVVEDRRRGQGLLLAEAAHHQLSLDAGDQRAWAAEAAADKAPARFGTGAIRPATLADNSPHYG